MSVSDGAVNRNPSQLLRFLGLSGPDAPNRVADVVVGGVPLLPWWLLANEQVGVASAAPGVGFVGLLTTASLTVPADQRWIITAFSVSTVLAAAHTIKLMGAFSMEGFSFAVGVAQAFVALEAANVDAFNGRGRDAWWTLKPGEIVGPFIAGNTGAAPAAVNLRIKFVSYPA